MNRWHTVRYSLYRCAAHHVGFKLIHFSLSTRLHPSSPRSCSIKYDFELQPSLVFVLPVCKSEAGLPDAALLPHFVTVWGQANPCETHLDPVHSGEKKNVNIALARKW